MTKPTLTYGQGYLFDCDSTSSWAETESGATSALVCVDKDFFEMTATLDNVNEDEWAYYELDIGDISTVTYPTYVVRWKTDVASAGMRAKIEFVFSSGSDMVVLGYNTSWTVTTGTLTTGKTLDKIRLYIDDYPDSLGSGTFHAYFDFVMICKGIFTFPFVSDTEGIELENNHRYLRLPGRVGNKTQYLGADSPTITLSGEMDTATTWGTPDGQYMIDVWKNSHAERFQWFASDLINCKVTMPKLRIRKKAGSRTARLYECELKKYDRSSGDSTYQSNLEWLGL